MPKNIFFNPSESVKSRFQAGQKAELTSNRAEAEVGRILQIDP